MADAATLQAQIAALEAAYAKGHLNVKYGDRSITYQSSTELRNVLSDLRDQLAATQGTTRRRALRMRQSGRGY